jgi:hypothetical protein
MKSVFFILLTILFTLMPNLGHAGEQSWEYKDWSVSTQDGIIRYIANGSSVHGHQFGFIKKAKNCDQDLLWISWSTYKKGVERFKGTSAIFQLSVGNAKVQIEVPLLTVYEVNPLLTLAAFTNFAAGEKLIALLGNGVKIQVTIIAPNDLVGKFDIVTDIFSLDGFSAARSKAKDLCESL